MHPYNLLAIIGPTASGKTALAAQLAARLDGEVISADSRQVYRGMDIGTGKDMEDYWVDGKQIPVHLTDIADAGYQYNVFEYQRDFLIVLADLRKRDKFPVLCGGSGLYIEAVLQHYKLISVPVNEKLRSELSGRSLAELTDILLGYTPKLHNITDIVNQKRAIRAIEIANYYSNLKTDLSDRLPDIEAERRSRSIGTDYRLPDAPELYPLIVGISVDLQTRRDRITRRLHQRLDGGMVDEVRKLLGSGIRPEELIYYGLEYKFITLCLTGVLSYPEMVEKLNIAIHQFAKRQMTWFRRMERQGIVIHWIDGNLHLEGKIEMVLSLIKGRS